MAGEEGCTWDLFEQNARDNEIESSCMSSRHPISPTTGRLCREDMAIYGEVPVTDCLSLVVCRQCQRVFKSEAVTKHRECYHSEVMQLSLLHALPTVVPSPHSIAQPSQALSTSSPSDTPVEHSQQGVQGKEDEEEGTFGFTASALPTIATAAAAPGTRNNSRDYDPDKHCSVWMEAERRYCTHSLTCKVHSVSERREVKGRSSRFDELLEEHRKRRKMKKHRLRGEMGMSQTLSGQDGGCMSPISPSSPLFIGGPSSSNGDISLGNSSCSGDGRESLSSHQAHDNQSPQSAGTPTTPDPQWGYKDHLNTFPQPLATCSLSCRSSRGTLVFGRRGDNLRTLLARLSGREGEYMTITPHRKHSYNSLLEGQRNRKRKYFSHREQLSHLHPTTPPVTDAAVTLRPSALPLPLSLTPAQPLPQTPSTPLPNTPSHQLARTPSQVSNSRRFLFSLSFPTLPADPFLSTSVSDNFVSNKASDTTISSVLPVANSAMDDVSAAATSISQLSSLNLHQQPGATHSQGCVVDSSGVPVSQVIGATGSLFVPGKFYSNSAHDPMSLINPVATQPHQTPRYHEVQQQQQLQQQQQQQIWQQQLKKPLHQQQHAQFVGPLVSHGTIAAIGTGSELPAARNLTLEEWGSGVAGPRVRLRRRVALGINGESVGVDQDLTGVARESGVIDEDDGERVVLGIKRKKVSGKKSKSKRQLTDPHHGLHPRHSITEDSVNNFAVSPAPVSSSLWDGPRANTAGVPPLIHAAMIHPTTIASAVETTRVGNMSPVVSTRPPSEAASLALHASTASSFQTGNGVPATSNSNNLVPGGSGLSYSQNVYVSESVRARTGQVSVTTPTSQIVTRGGHVATPISQLAVSGSASSNEPHRLAPEFGHIRVKVEPGLPDHDSHKSSLNKSLPNGLISSQCNTLQLTTASPAATIGGGGTSGTGSPIPPLSRPHSFNSLCSPGHTLVLNPSSPHPLPPINQQQPVSNLLGFRHLYSNQQLLAAAAVAQSPSQSIQQLASIQQQHNAALYKQAMANKSLLMLQHQQQVRLLQPTATTPKTPPVLGGSGGVRSYQQVSSGTAGCLPRLQLTGAKQGVSTPINVHHRQNMPTLTPGKVRAPISHVPSGVAGFNGPDGHRTMPTLTPGGISRTQNSMPPPPLGPYHQNKSSAANPASDRPHLPSQQVT